MCQFEQGGVQAFVDQQFRRYAFFASLYRATSNGFFSPMDGGRDGKKQVT
jgi:hypothetical protein